MTADDVLAVVRALDHACLWFRLDGGWGVDALAGRETRSHDDLDLVLERKDAARAEAALQSLGYRYDRTAVPGLPARHVLRSRDGRQVDLHVVLRDAAGDAWQELGGGAWGRYPAGGLAGRGLVGGIPVPCITVELQLSHHAGYPPRDVDRHDVAVLARLSGREVPPPYR